MKSKTQAKGGELPAGTERLVRMPEVCRLTGLSKTSIYSGVKAGTFPGAVRVTDWAVAWRQSDLDRWIASRMPADPEPATASRPASARNASMVLAATAESAGTTTKKAGSPRNAAGKTAKAQHVSRPASSTTAAKHARARVTRKAQP